MKSNIVEEILYHGVRMKRKIANSRGFDVEIVEVEDEVSEIVVPAATVNLYVGYDMEKPEPVKTKRVFKGIKKICLSLLTEKVKMDNNSVPDLEEVCFIGSNKDTNKCLTFKNGALINREKEILNVLNKGCRKYIIGKEINSIADYAFAGTGIEEFDMEDRNKEIDFRRNTFSGTKFGEMMEEKGYGVVGDTLLILKHEIDEMILDASVVNGFHIVDEENVQEQNINIKKLVLKKVGKGDMLYLRNFAWADIGEIVVCDRLTKDVLNVLKKIKSESVTINDVGNYVFDDGMIYTSDKKQLLYCPKYMKKDVVNIPEGVVMIDDKVFAYSTDIKKVICPKSLRIIGNSAFANSKIKEVVLQEGIEILSSFSYMELQRIRIPESVKIIDSQCFYESKCEESIHIPEGVECIKRHAVLMKRAVRSLCISDTVKVLEEESLKGVNTVILKSYRVKNLINSLDYNKEFVIVNVEDSGSYMIPVRYLKWKYVSYFEYLNRCWNSGDISLFEEAYKNIFYKLGNEKEIIPLKWAFADFNYHMDNVKYGMYRVFLQKHACEIVVRTFHKSIDDVSRRAIIKIIKDDFMNMEELKTVLGIAREANEVSISSALLQKMNEKGFGDIAKTLKI